MLESHCLPKNRAVELGNLETRLYEKGFVINSLIGNSFFFI